MKLQDHANYDRLAATVDRIVRDGLVIPWSGELFRFATPKYAKSHDLISGIGSRNHGGRWNAPGTFRTVYASTTPELAVAEALGHYRYFGIPEHEALPRILKALSVTLSNVLDLRNGPLRTRLRVSEHRMVNEPWREEQNAGQEAITQALGRAAHAAGCEGLMVRSAQIGPGYTAIIFPDNLVAGSVLKALQ